MTHSIMATSLWKAAAAIEAVADWCDPKLALVLRPLVATLNRIGDWHASQHAAGSKPTRRAA
jgi:hypothetical protein